LPVADGVALPEAQVEFDGSAAEILIDADARLAVLRYQGSARVDVLPLDGSPATCFEAAAGAVTDVTLARSGELVVVRQGTLSSLVNVVALSDATPEPCAPFAAGVDVGAAVFAVADPSGGLALAYQPNLAIETAAIVDLAALSATSITLEKAIAAVAFVGDGQHVLISHLKAPGAPAWDPQIEDPEVSVDKSYGVSWLNLLSRAHRLAVSDVPFGPFTFVPAADNGGEGATFQSVADDKEPQVLRVSHRPGFGDRWIDLAAKPLQMGYAPETTRVWVTQSHPWGRVTFMDPLGLELRHVTGFALEVE
jgi:hypothetical protein